jgi:iron(III) transport system permease protein
LTGRKILRSAALVVFLIGALPLAVMLGRSFWVDHQLSAQRYVILFESGHLWRLLANSLTIAALTALACSAIGVFAGLILGRTDARFRRLLVVSLTLPLTVPPYLLAIAWTTLLGRDGLLAPWLPPLLAEQLYAGLFGLPGCIWILFCAYMPAVMLLTIVSIRAVNPHLEQAARLVCGWRRVLATITLPLASRGITLAFVLVFLLVMGEVSVPMFLRYPVFPVETLIQFSAMYDFGMAAAAAGPLLLVALLLILVERGFVDRQSSVMSARIVSRRPLTIRLGIWRIPATLAVALIALLTTALPFLALLVASGSWHTYREALQRAGDSIGRSLLYAAAGTSMLTALGLLCGYLISRRSLPVWRLLDTTNLCLFATPGSVIAIGLISLWNWPATSLVYGSATIVFLGYLAQYLILPSRISAVALAAVPESLEQAARVAGASWLVTFSSIVLPAIAPGLIAAWLIGFVFCLRDVGITLLLYPPGEDTLPVRILTLMANGAPNLIAALSVCMVALTLLPVAVFFLYFRTRVRL